MEKIKTSHTKEKIITVFYAKQGIKASHAFVFPSKPKFGILSEGGIQASKGKQKYAKLLS